MEPRGPPAPRATDLPRTDTDDEESRGKKVSPSMALCKWKSTVHSCPVTWQVLTGSSGLQSQASHFIVLYRATNRKREGTKEEIALLVV